MVKKKTIDEVERKAMKRNVDGDQLVEKNDLFHEELLEGMEPVFRIQGKDNVNYELKEAIEQMEEAVNSDTTAGEFSENDVDDDPIFVDGPSADKEYKIEDEFDFSNQYSEEEKKQQKENYKFEKQYQRNIMDRWITKEGNGYRTWSDTQVGQEIHQKFIFKRQLKSKSEWNSDLSE
jgi:hypothetical protein